MSIVYHGTTIDSTGQVNYTKNGVTTNLTKVYYRKNGVDTLVWSKERNQAAVSNSVVSASGGTTLNNYRSLEILGPAGVYRISGGGGSGGTVEGINWINTGNATYGTHVYTRKYADGDWMTSESIRHSDTYARALAYGEIGLNQVFTDLSYFDYTTTLRMNLLYASSKHVKIYCNDVLTTEADVTSQTEALTATYRDMNTFTSRNATIPLKIEIYDMGGTLEETWTGNMASSATITYEG